VPKSVNTAEYDQFRKLFVEARVEAGVGQRELARRLGISHSILNKMESGYRRMDVVEFLQIIRLLGKSPGEFLTKLESEIDQPAIFPAT
jgi:transcriptional regulator with XRE-family HTH domain